MAVPVFSADQGNWGEHFSAALHQQRDRVREFLAAQQDRLKRAQAQLAAQLQLLADELARNRAETREAREEIQRRSEQLSRQIAALEELRKEYDARQLQWEELHQRSAKQHEALLAQIRQQQHELDQRREELRAAREALTAQEAELHQQRRELELACNQHVSQLQQLEALRGELDRQRAELAAREKQLAELQSRLQFEQQDLLQRRQETELQRRRIAEALKSQHASQLKQLRRLQAELDHRDQTALRQLQHQLELARQSYAQQTAELESLRARHDQLLQELASQPAAAPAAAPESTQLEQLQAERDELLERLSATEGRLAETAEQVADVARQLSQSQQHVLAAEERLAQATQRLERSEARAAATEAALAESRKQLELLNQQLLEAQEELARRTAVAAEGTAPQDQMPEEDFRRLYELALEDLRELKARNAELQQQLARLPSTAQTSSGFGDGKLDWEAEKRRILAMLESAEEDESEAFGEQRLKIEEIVRRTDAIIAEKDQEIAELRQLLDAQASNLGAVAVGAAALGEILDKDAIIQEERENLRKLQEQWREKLREAEIELSLERARIARERLQLEEKLRQLPPAGGAKADEPAKPARGRWLARLGLANGGEKKQS